MEEKIILNTDKESAEYRTDIKGWVSKDGRFFGKDESLARYSGSTHRKCDKCESLIEKTSYCEKCHIEESESVFPVENHRCMTPKPITDNKMDLLYNEVRNNKGLSEDELKILKEEMDDIEIPKEETSINDIKIVRCKNNSSEYFGLNKKCGYCGEVHNVIDHDSKCKPKEEKINEVDGIDNILNVKNYTGEGVKIAGALLPDKDGWIEHIGTTCPVDGETEIKLKINGEERYVIQKAKDCYWGDNTNITHYRLHKEEKKSMKLSEFEMPFFDIHNKLFESETGYEKQDDKLFGGKFVYCDKNRNEINETMYKEAFNDWKSKLNKSRPVSEWTDEEIHNRVVNEELEKSIFKIAEKKWGIESQLDVAIEECAELIDSIIKLRRGRVKEKDVITEIADVQMMINQLKIYFGDDLVKKEYVYKLNRLRERLA